MPLTARRIGAGTRRALARLLRLLAAALLPSATLVAAGLPLAVRLLVAAAGRERVVGLRRPVALRLRGVFGSCFVVALRFGAARGRLRRLPSAWGFVRLSHLGFAAGLRIVGAAALAGLRIRRALHRLARTGVLRSRTVALARRPGVGRCVGRLRVRGFALLILAVGRWGGRRIGRCGRLPTGCRWLRLLGARWLTGSIVGRGRRLTGAACLVGLRSLPAFGQLIRCSGLLPRIGRLDRLTSASGRSAVVGWLQRRAIVIGRTGLSAGIGLSARLTARTVLRLGRRLAGLFARLVVLGSHR